jgi:hypothetical protein
MGMVEEQMRSAKRVGKVTKVSYPRPLDQAA